MYLVSYLLPQYNEKHNTNKQFNNYLRNQEVKDVVEELAKSVRSDPSLPSNGSQDDQNTGISKSIFPSNDYQNGKFDIPGVIQYVTTPSFDGANKGYIICEELLHACLRWAYRVFACAVLRFITCLRQQYNDYLLKANEELNQENKKLKNRFVPAEIPDTDTTLEWYFFLTYYSANDNIEIRANFCQKDRWNNVQRQIAKNKGCLFYCIKNIPNGWTFKRWMKEPIRKICEKYGGNRLPQCKFLVPEHIWNLKQKEILCSIRLQAKQARIDLGWRTDLNDLNKE